MSTVEAFLATHARQQAGASVVESVHVGDAPAAGQVATALVVVNPNVADKIKAARVEGREARVGDSANALKAVVDRYNENHFIAPHGKGVAVYTEKHDYELDRPGLEIMNVQAFKELHRHDLVSVPDNGGFKQVRAVDVWHASIDRRCYTGGVIFDPAGTGRANAYNLYQGFGVTATAGDVSFLTGYIKSLLCSGNEEQFQYLINWLAYAVQYPERQAEVAIVLRGGKGIGKSTLGRLMVRIFGAHGLQITNSRHLLGNFNNHLRTTLILFADEAFYAGDAQGASVLKGLVTEEFLVVEQKGVDPIQVRNRLKIIMASNSDWVVPASGDERRFFVLEVSDEKQGDHDYWRTLNKNIADGGAEAFLDYLLQVDLSAFNVRDVPQTTGLAKQKLQSLNALESFLFDGLVDGSLCGHPWVAGDAPEIPCAVFMERLAEYCQKHAQFRYARLSARYVGLHLLEMAGASKGQLTGVSRPRCYRFPELNDARETFTKWARLGEDFQWEGTE